MRRVSLGLTVFIMACSGPTAPPPPVASVSIQAVTTSVGVGSSLTLSVILRDAAGDVLTNRTVAFTSSNASVLSVDATGLVRALAEGEATITASCEQKTGQLTMSVVRPGQSPWDY